MRAWRALALAALLGLCAAPAAAADHLTVLLDWFINPDHAPLLLAEETGAFKRAGLDVDLVQPADATIPPRLVAAGHGDIALTAEPQFHEQIAAGLPLTRIGVLIGHPLSTLVSLASEGVTSPAGLRGKRVGYGSGDVEKAMVGAMLGSAGLSLRDVEMVQVGEQLTLALLTRRVDAVTVYRNFETLELQAHGAAVNGLDYERYGVPDFEELIYVVRRDRAADPRLPRFLRAIAEATAALRADPAGSFRRAAAARPDFDTALNRQSWQVTVPYFAPHPEALNETAYRNFAAFLAKSGVIGPPPPVSSYTARLVP